MDFAEIVGACEGSADAVFLLITLNRKLISRSKNDMPATTMEPTEHPPATAVKKHAAFFRQSGWLMIATIIGGIMSYAVHFLSKRIPNEQYSIFGTMLMVTACLPTTPLQMIFAQQTASALVTSRERQLAGMIRLIWLWITLFWAVAVVAILAFQGPITARWGMTNPALLWVTLLSVLVSVWASMFNGMLQGRQDFLWMGWSAIIGGVGRLGVAALLVLALSGGATSMITGALIGLGTSLGIAVWRTRDLWSLRKEPFDGAALYRQLIPLSLGFWACQIMFTTDMIFATAFFSGDETAPYLAVGTMSRALLWLVLPLATVMFPKLVHSHAKAEKSDLLGIVLMGTALLAICGALGVWLVGPLAVRLVGKAEWVTTAKVLLPWYAAALVPLALANVLANDLLARGRFRVVPFMVALAVAYGFAIPYALTHFSHRLETILQVLGVFNLLLFAVTAWFAFHRPKARPV
jgi:O-antigen/teichoic acid export membrane protein